MQQTRTGYRAKAARSLIFCLLTGMCLQSPAGETITGTPNADVESAEPIVSQREKVDLVEDSSIAEALERRPDLNFANVTIDGEKTTLSLDEIPADQVEAANVSKAVTPDLDADMRGGGLNLRSKPAYALEERVLKGSIETEYFEVVDAFRSELSLTYGKSLGRWGFIATAARTQGTWGEDEYEQDWIRQSDGDGQRFLLAQQQIEHGMVDQVHDSINATVDFRATEEIRLYVKGDYRQSRRDQYRVRLDIRHDEGTYSNITTEGADVSGALLERTLFAYDADYDNYTLTTGGYLDFDAAAIDYQFSYTTWNYLEPEWLAARFRREDVDLSYDLTRVYGPAYRAQEEAAANLADPDTFQNDWMQLERWEEDHTDWVGSVNAQFPFRASWVKGHFKTGLKARGLEFIQSAEATVYDEFDGSFTMTEVISDYRNPDALDGLFEHGPFPAYRASLDFLKRNLDRFSVNETRTREASDLATYRVERDIAAGYGLLYLDFNHLKVISGLRHERTDRSYKASELVLSEEGAYVSTNQLSGSNGYENWFPGIHGSYAWSNFRFIGSWSNTIERPRFGIIVPYRSIAREDRFIEEGNPQLQPTLYSNFDFSIDYELENGNTLSLELFSQTVEDIVYYETSIIADGNYAGYELGTYRNGPSAEVRGVRLIWAQHLGDWLPYAEGLYLNARYLYQESETTYPSRPGTSLPVTGHPGNEWEITFAYEREKLFLQLDIQYSAANLEEINESESWRDVFEESVTFINFSGSYELFEGIRVFLDIDNLTGERDSLERYGRANLLTQYEAYPRHFSFGVRFDL